MAFDGGLTAQDLLQTPDMLNGQFQDADSHVTILELDLAKSAELKIEKLGAWEALSSNSSFAVSGRG